MRLVEFTLYDEDGDSKIFINSDKIIAVSKETSGKTIPTEIEMDGGIVYTVKHSIEYVITKLRNNYG